MGKRGKLSDFISGVEHMQASGIEVVRVPRGGETTYHGPGQIVAYPVINIRKLGLGARAYVEALEDAMIRTAGIYGVSAQGRLPGRTGVWVGDRKIGAVGVAISGGITRHGLAFNVNNDLSAFSSIIACGDRERQATSLVHEVPSLDTRGILEHVAGNLSQCLALTLGFDDICWIPELKHLADV